MRRCCKCGGKAEIISSAGVLINDCVRGYKVICSNIGCSNSTEWTSSEYDAISLWQDANKK